MPPRHSPPGRTDGPGTGLARELLAQWAVLQRRSWGDRCRTAHWAKRSRFRVRGGVRRSPGRVRAAPVPGAARLRTPPLARLPTSCAGPTAKGDIRKVHPSPQPYVPVRSHPWRDGRHEPSGPRGGEPEGGQQLVAERDEAHQIDAAHARDVILAGSSLMRCPGGMPDAHHRSGGDRGRTTHSAGSARPRGGGRARGISHHGIAVSCRDALGVSPGHLDGGDGHG